jgi:hypothetical protein
MIGGQLLLSWSRQVCLSSGCSSMSPVSATFWHVSGTLHRPTNTPKPLRPLDLKLPAVSGSLGNYLVQQFCLFFIA